MRPQRQLGTPQEREFDEAVRKQLSTYRFVVDGWYQENVAISQTNVELNRGDSRFFCDRNGSVIGLTAIVTGARTAGTLTVKIFKNTGLAGAAGSQLGTLSVVLDATHTSRAFKIQKSGFATFKPGDEIYATLTTDGSWAPTTSDVRVSLTVEVADG